MNEPRQRDSSIKRKEKQENTFKEWFWYFLWCSWVGHKIKGCEPCPRCGELLPIGGKKNH